MNYIHPSVGIFVYSLQLIDKLCQKSDTIGTPVLILHLSENLCLQKAFLIVGHIYDNKVKVTNTQTCVTTVNIIIRIPLEYLLLDLWV